MGRYIGRDAHASSCTLGVMTPSGKRIGSHSGGDVPKLARPLAELLYQELDALDALKRCAPRPSGIRSSVW